MQAVGTLAVSFAESGVDAMTVTAHKIGGPVGVGALLLGRGVDCVPVLHGGGQERDVRSGTLDTPGAVGFALAAELAVGRRPELAPRLARLRDELIDGVRQAVPDAVLNGHPVHRLPGNAHLSFPGCEGDSLLMLLDARGIECSTGSACSAGVAQPSHVLLAMGADEQRARGALRLSLGHNSTAADVRAVVEAIGPVVERARRASAAAGVAASRRARRMRVLAAMSGGVDSAVAAARAVAAGWDVTGVHLALSRQPATLRTGSRGCCSLEDSHDARRTADILGIPFYVWDFAERFAADVIDDFVAEYEAGRTPNPCLRCNEKIKFAALLDRALALGFDAVVTGHHARLVGGRLSRSVDAAKDQSYVLAVLTPEQLAHAVFPLGDSTKDQVRAEAARLGLAVATKPDSHDICFIADGDTQAFLARRLGERPGDIVDTDGTVLGSHAGTHGFTVGQRRGLNLTRPSATGEPRYVLSISPKTNTVVVGGADDLRVGLVRCGPPVWIAAPPSGPLDCQVQLRAHGMLSTARVSSEGTGLVAVLGEPQRGVAAGQALVMYDGDQVLGSATILGTERAAQAEGSAPAERAAPAGAGQAASGSMAG